MHEAGIAREVLDLALGEAGRTGRRRVVRVRVRLGVFCGVDPEALRFAFEALRAGTRAEGAAIEVERVPALMECTGCGARVEIEEVDFVCRGCGALLRVVGGGEMMELSEIEVN